MLPKVCWNHWILSIHSNFTKKCKLASL